MNPFPFIPFIISSCPQTAPSIEGGRGESPRPNVIFIVADDLGYGDLSCYGATRVQTPAVDELARRGTRFTDVHACASTSTPSRYGLLTGCYPFRKKGTDVAAGNAGMIISPDQFTLADLFHEAGYATAAIGKWHLGLGSKTAAQDWNGRLDISLADIGFDYSYIMAATADRVPCVFIENDHVANHDPSAPIEVSYQKPFEGEPTGRDNPKLLTKLRSSHGHDMAIVNGIGRIGYMRGGGKALWRDEDIADSITAHAIGFIEQHRGEPFFMYLCTNDVHVPRYPHDRFRGKSPMGLRGDAILQFDWTVEQVTRTLERLGLTDNTLIILTSDNGPVLDDGYAERAVELAGSHAPGGPFRGGKYSAFEAGSAVPFIVSWPGHVPQGKTSKALVALTDAVASMSSLTGTPIPAGQASDSRNYLSTWLGQKQKSCPYVVCMAANRSLTLRTPEWKYISSSDGPPIVPWGTDIETGYRVSPQLYDIRHDVGERNDVSTSHPRLMKKLEAILNHLK